MSYNVLVLISFPYLQSWILFILNIFDFFSDLLLSGKNRQLGQSNNFLSIQIKSPIILTLYKFSDWIENYQKYDGTKRVTLKYSSFKRKPISKEIFLFIFFDTHIDYHIYVSVSEEIYSLFLISYPNVFIIFLDQEQSFISLSLKLFVFLTD